MEFNEIEFDNNLKDIDNLYNECKILELEELEYKKKIKRNTFINCISLLKKMSSKRDNLNEYFDIIINKNKIDTIVVYLFISLYLIIDKLFNIKYDYSLNIILILQQIISIIVFLYINKYGSFYVRFINILKNK